jgi:hypothetical protein
MLKRPGRKLLVASLGVAAVSYVACGNNTVANLAPPPNDAAKDSPQDALVANLAPPPPDAGIDASDSSTDATTDSSSDASSD